MNPAHRADRRSFLRTAVAGGLTTTSFAAAPAGAAGWSPHALEEQLSQVSPVPGDNSKALRRRIAQLPRTGGVLRLRPGTYAIRSTVPIDRPVRIVSDGPGVTVTATMPPFAIESDRVAFEGIEFVADAPTSFLAEAVGENHHGLRITGCRFSGLSVNITKRGREMGGGAINRSGTGLTHDVQIVDCEFTGYEQNYTVEIGGIQDAVIERCWIHDTGLNLEAGDGIKVLHGSVGTRIAFNTIEDVARDGIDVYDSHENTIIGNLIRAPGAQGVDAKWGAEDTLPLGRDLVANNRVYDAGENAFAVDVNDALVTGNFAHGARQYGFTASTSNDDSLTPTTRVQFIGNHAIDCEGGFSYSAGSGFILIGNVVEGCSGYGIALGSDTSGFTLLGNRSVNNGDSDIGIDGSVARKHFLAGNTTDGRYDSDVVMQGTLRHAGERMGFFGAEPVTRPSAPGRATGSDADVINAVVDALRGLGLVT